MELKKQVIDLPQAKRLAELGVKAPSLFSWIAIMPDPIGEKYYIEPVYQYENIDTLTEYIAPAYTVAELGMMLPKEFKIEKEGLCHIQCYFSIDPNSLGGFISINTYPERISLHTIYGNTEAQARAAMLIYLLENNYITAEQINEI